MTLPSESESSPKQSEQHQSALHEELSAMSRLAGVLKSMGGTKPASKSDSEEDMWDSFCCGGYSKVNPDTPEKPD